ncbi:MAG: L,D-transpeptidase family protein [Bacteroidales bacterium]|nr:L,D-transpeptidase family protein [Bacteroidales bacterium]
MTLQAAKEQFAADPGAKQLLAVESTGGADATVNYFVKADNGNWTPVFSGAAFIGKNGLGKTQEGDSKTPEGVFRPIAAFGIMPNPGCLLPYIDITPGTVACDAEGPLYNRIVKPGDYLTEPEGEKMWLLSPKYDYGLQIDFNPQNIYPLGSAIFIHCKSYNPYTGGCVALDRGHMIEILRSADAGLRICIF